MTTQTRSSATETTAPTTGTTPSTVHRSVVEPDRLHDAFMAATNAHDVEALLDLYERDGLAVQLDGALARGEDELRAMCVGLTTAIARIDGSTRKLLVAGDVALSSARWSAEVVLPDGSTVTAEGSTAEVLRRQSDGTWRMVIDDPAFG